jgi:tetratricopeptide (TPR) repeat protein
VAAAPASTKAHHKLGEELLRAGELGDALRSLDLALEIAPGNVFAEETLGVARQAVAERWLAPGRGDPGDGVPPGVPRDADILYTIGTIRRQRGEPEAAEACWRAALEVDPRRAATLGDLGAARMEAGDFGEAERLLEGAVEARPRLAPPWFNLGRLRLERGDAAGAFEALERFVELAGGRYPSEEAWARGVLARRAAP